MAKRCISLPVKWMIEHHECKKWFVFIRHPEHRRSIHAGVCCRLYRQWNTDYAGPDCIPHSCCNNAGTSLNYCCAGYDHSPGQLARNRPSGSVVQQPYYRLSRRQLTSIWQLTRTQTSRYPVVDPVLVSRQLVPRLLISVCHPVK